MTKHPIKVFLVDDQAIISESVRMMLDDEEGIEFFYCSDPTKAIDQAVECKPTVILIDLIMPEVDGMTLVKYLRANPMTTEIPIIVLSSKEESAVKAEAFANGANDYMVKLPGKEELVARVRYHSKGYINFLERNEAFEALEDSRAALQRELDDAAEYVLSLLPSKWKNGIKTEWEYYPSAHLGGDIFDYKKIGDDQYIFYLLDVCGHGVATALLSISIMHAITQKNYLKADLMDPAAVLNELNDHFQMEEHNNLYFTLWYGAYDKKAGTLIYSSGGHPPAILYRKNGECQQLSTDGMLIGGMPDIYFRSDFTRIEKGDKLLLFSDGVYEHQTSEGKRLGYRDFFASIHQIDGKRILPSALEYARRIAGPPPYEDDFSLLLIEF